MGQFPYVLLVLLFPTQSAPAAAGYVNVAQLINELWAPLNASGAGDAVFWNDTDLYQWADEAIKKLARMTSVFVTYDQSITIAAGTAVYSLPDRHVSTIQADLAGRVLRARTVAQMLAEDVTYQTTEDTPRSLAQDEIGTTKARLYPVPDAGADTQVLGLVEETYPAEITAANGILTGPAFLKEYLRFAMLGEARARESKAQMRDTADWLRQIAGMMAQSITNYYGGAQ